MVGIVRTAFQLGDFLIVGSIVTNVKSTLHLSLVVDACDSRLVVMAFVLTMVSHLRQDPRLNAWMCARKPQLTDTE